MFSISDKYGKVRTEYSKEELDSLDDTKCEALIAVITAARKSETADADDKAANTSVDDALSALDAAEKAIRATLPPAPDRIDEVRRMSENSRRASMGLPPVQQKVFKPKKELVDAVAVAEKALSAARQRAAQTGIERRAALGVLTETIKTWQRMNTVSTEDAIRDHLARQQEYYRKIADGEVETREEIEHTPSHLDRSLGSGRNVGNHHAANYGYGRKHSRRGTVIAPKPPSQR